MADSTLRPCPSTPSVNCSRDSFLTSLPPLKVPTPPIASLTPPLTPPSSTQKLRPKLRSIETSPAALTERILRAEEFQETVPTMNNPTAVASQGNSAALPPFSPPLSPILNHENALFPASDSSLRDVWDSAAPHLVTKPVTFIVDSMGKQEEYGKGSWSIVKVGCIKQGVGPTAGPLSNDIDQASPTDTAANTSVKRGRLWAIKCPIREDARELLLHEAKVLKYLQTMSFARSHDNYTEFCDYIIKMIGVMPTTYALVLRPEQCNLFEFSKKALETARATLTTSNMCSPVIGKVEWVYFAKHLIRGLAWLHHHNIVHGDIKPQNILITEREFDGGSEHEIMRDLKVKPIFCDFSSSRFVDPYRAATPVSAVTTAYTAPELLCAFSKRNLEDPIVTFQSDMFSLGATLIVPAIGSGPYDGMQLEIQRTACARQGAPLDFAQGTDQGSRIMKNGFVYQLLAPGLEQHPEDRRVAIEWWHDFLEIQLALPYPLNEL